jgi:hypothetical protein
MPIGETTQWGRTARSRCAPGPRSARLEQAAALLDVGHDDVGRALLEQLAEAVAQVEVLAAADRRRGRLADVAHRVHVLRRHRLLEPEQLEGLGLLRHALARRHVVAAVHVDREVDALREELADEADLAHHGVDLGVARRPVHQVPAVRVLALVDVDLDAVKPMSRMPPSFSFAFGSFGSSVCESQ